MKILKEKFLKIYFIICSSVISFILLVVFVATRINFNDCINIAIRYADEYNLSRTMVISVIKVESNFNSNAVSPKGAIGLMQITQSTFDYVCNIEGFENLDIYNPNHNVMVGCCYLKYLFDKFQTHTASLAAYNAGEGNVRNWLENSQYSSDGKNLISIPFVETSNYVKNVEKYNKYYKKYER